MLFLACGGAGCARMGPRGLWAPLHVQSQRPGGDSSSSLRCCPLGGPPPLSRSAHPEPSNDNGAMPTIPCGNRGTTSYARGRGNPSAHPPTWPFTKRRDLGVGRRGGGLPLWGRGAGQPWASPTPSLPPRGTGGPTPAIDPSRGGVRFLLVHVNALVQVGQLAEALRLHLCSRRVFYTPTTRT